MRCDAQAQSPWLSKEDHLEPITAPSLPVFPCLLQSKMVWFAFSWSETTGGAGAEGEGCGLQLAAKRMQQPAPKTWSPDFDPCCLEEENLSAGRAAGAAGKCALLQPCSGAGFIQAIQCSEAQAGSQALLKIHDIEIVRSTFPVFADLFSYVLRPEKSLRTLCVCEVHPARYPAPVKDSDEC